MQIIPYNPKSDPKQYMSQALQNMLGGIFEKYERKRVNADLQNIGSWARGGFQGQQPQMQTKQGQEQLSQMLDPLHQAQIGYYQAGTKARLQPKKTKTEQLMAEGYTNEEAKLIQDISHGLKPRASSAKHYENMSDVEKMKFLQTLLRSAEGPYYKTISGTEEPLNPKVAKWAGEELKKLSMFKEQQPKRDLDLEGMLTPEMRGEMTELKAADEPQTIDEFYQKVTELKATDMEKAKAYYEKWISKWQ